MEPNRLKPTVLASTMFRGGMLASLVLLSTACSNEGTVTEPVTNGAPHGIVAGNLEASAADGAITLRNTTDQQISYLLVDKDQAIAAIYPVCDVAHCTNLAQGASASVSYTLIPGYTSKSTEVLVYWTRYSVGADGTRVLNGREEITNVKLK
ncbi:MAG: hypothetical protein ABJB74_05245 [Gemmatimonas sp.]